jgi:uncharacterized SAM-binding protein YcdF (DUF218 family)
MYDYLSEFTAPFLTPIGLCLVVWIAGLGLRLNGYRIWGKCCTVGGILVLLAFSSPLVGGALLASLEDDYPLIAAAACQEADAIVVLGGVTSPPVPPRETIDVGGGFDRLLHGLRLLRLGKAPILVLSGGGAAGQAGMKISEAARLYQLALEYGVEPRSLRLEERSNNTYENARFTSELLLEEGLSTVLLVTSAAHMPRAAAAFKKQGLNTVAAPTDLRAIDESRLVHALMPGLNGLEYSTIALREYCGLAIYWVRRWI